MGALGMGSGDKPGTSGQRPIALELRRLMRVGKERGVRRRERNGTGYSFIFLESFYLSLAGRNPRGGPSGGFQQNIHQFSRCVLSGSWSPLTGQ